jgi:DNA-binding transcriptional LysR family regulator
MDLFRALHTFVTVAGADSLSDAARQLSVTPSAISKQISALEADLGITLLSRTTRGLRLTSFGEEYLSRAVGILTDVAEARDTIRESLTSPRGILRISAPVTFGRLHVATALPAFMAQYPNVRIELRLYDRQVDPIAAGVDVSIRMGQLRDSTMIAAKLAPTQRVLCASPTYLARYGKPESPEDLQKHNCLISSLYTVRNTWHFKRGGEARAVAVNGTFSTNNSETLREVAIEGVGIALLGSWAVAPYVEAGLLVPVLTDWRGEVTRELRNIYAVYPRAARISPNVRSFIKFLRDYYGSPPYWHEPTRSRPFKLPPGTPLRASVAPRAPA